MTQGKFKLAVWPEYHANIDTLGDWDGTCDKSFQYLIFDEQGGIEERCGGFHKEEQAREAGEKVLKILEGRV